MRRLRLRDRYGLRIIVQCTGPESRLCGKLGFSRLIKDAESRFILFFFGFGILIKNPEAVFCVASVDILLGQD